MVQLEVIESSAKNLDNFAGFMVPNLHKHDDSQLIKYGIIITVNLS